MLKEKTVFLTVFSVRSSAILGTIVWTMLLLMNPGIVSAFDIIYSGVLFFFFYVVLFFTVACPFFLLSAVANFHHSPPQRQRLRHLFECSLFLAGSWLCCSNAISYRLCFPEKCMTLLVSFAVLSGIIAVASGLLAVFRRTGRSLFRRAFLVVLILSFPFILVRPKPEVQARVASEGRDDLRQARLDTGLKVLLIGIDGMDSEVLLPLIERGEVPALRGLVARGSSGDIASIPPGLSPPIWASIMTGKLPRDHGIADYEFMSITGMTQAIEVFPSRTFLTLLAKAGLAELSLFSSHERKKPALWTVTKAAGVTTAVTCWLTTAPTEKVSGTMITDQYYHYRKMEYTGNWAFYPADAGQSLPWYDFFSKDIQREARETLLAPLTEPLTPALFYRIFAEGKTAAEVACAVIERDKPEFGAVFLNPVDAISHLYWGYRQKTPSGPDGTKGLPGRETDEHSQVVSRAYRWMDTFVDRLMALVDDRTVIIVTSDHGFQDISFTRYFYYRLWQRTHITGIHDTAHPPDGFAVLAGGPVRRNGSVSAMSIIDVTPNILYLLGLPVGKDMPGRVWTEIYDPAFLEQFPVRYIESYDFLSPEFATEADVPAESRVQQKKLLTALGYLL